MSVSSTRYFWNGPPTPLRSSDSPSWPIETQVSVATTSAPCTAATGSSVTSTEPPCSAAMACARATTSASRQVRRRRADPHVHPREGAAEEVAVRHVVGPVADVCEGPALGVAECLSHGEEVGEDLARVVEVGEGVDDGDARELRHLLEVGLLEGAPHDGGRLRAEDARDVGDRLAGPDAGEAAVDDHGEARRGRRPLRRTRPGCAGSACRRGSRRCAGPRGSGPSTARPSARAPGRGRRACSAAVRSSSARKWRVVIGRPRGAGVVAASRSPGQGVDEEVELVGADDEGRGEPDGVRRHRVDDEAGVAGVRDDGGRPVAGEDDGPQQAGARGSRRRGRRRAPRPARRGACRPRGRGRAAPRSRWSRRTASPAAQASGFPPNVEPCMPGVSIPLTSGPKVTSAPMGTPPPRPLARVIASGTTPGLWKANHAPVRPMPVWISSRTSRAPASRVIRGPPAGSRRRPARTPPSPWTGSRTTAPVSEVTAARRASTSPHGTWLTPGEQRLERLAVGLLVGEREGPVVRPWKAPSAATMPVRPVRRASLTAASIASVPLLQKKTAQPSGAPASVSSRSASSTCGMEVKKFETWTSCPACLEIAVTRAGWLWPRALTAMPPTRSR